MPSNVPWHLLSVLSHFAEAELVSKSFDMALLVGRKRDPYFQNGDAWRLLDTRRELSQLNSWGELPEVSGMSAVAIPALSGLVLPR